MTRTRRRWAYATSAGALVVCVAYALVLRQPGWAGPVVDDVSNWGQVLAAALASAGCVAAATRSHRSRRRAWGWIAAGTGSWAAGQAVWTYYETIQRVAVPYPSLADVGYLGFPLLAGWGLVVWLGTQGRGAARGRDVLDGLVIAGSLLMLSWIVVLEPVAQTAGEDSWFAFALSLAYPVGDLVLGTLVLLVLARADRRQRGSVLTVAAGLLCIAVADSTFVVLQGMSSFTSSDLPSNVGWFAGFLLVALAGAFASPVDASSESQTSGSGARGALQIAVHLAVPYVALVVSLGALGVRLLTGSRAHPVVLLLAATLVAMVLLRQFLAMLDNQRLLVELTDAQLQLRHQATHDSLTDLPNRVLLATRLDRALTAPERTVALLYCDLDDFKRVNDVHGHHVGDELLVVIADRLLGCTHERDTVARLGGDEFAILLADPSSADRVARAVLASVAHEVDTSAGRLAVSASIGIALHETGPAPDGLPPTEQVALRRDAAAVLMSRADAAMYDAKSAGKNRARTDAATAAA